MLCLTVLILNKYLVLSIISWTGRILALLCTTADTWESRDGAVSVLLSSQQEAVACVRCIQKDSHCSEGQLPASGGNRECRSLSNGKTSSSAKN
jgi:hypothetical protein